MAKFQITSAASSQDYGVFEADTAEAAILACVQEAGYDSIEHMEQVTGRDCSLIAEPAGADLFNLLDGIASSDFAAQTLDSADAVQSYAEACGQVISTEQAQRIMTVGRQWLTERENGNGEWSRMRDEARAALAA